MITFIYKKRVSSVCVSHCLSVVFLCLFVMVRKLYRMQRSTNFVPDNRRRQFQIHKGLIVWNFLSMLLSFYVDRNDSHISSIFQVRRRFVLIKDNPNSIFLTDSTLFEISMTIFKFRVIDLFKSIHFAIKKRISLSSTNFYCLYQFNLIFRAPCIMYMERPL